MNVGKDQFTIMLNMFIQSVAEAVRTPEVLRDFLTLCEWLKSRIDGNLRITANFHCQLGALHDVLKCPVSSNACDPKYFNVMLFRKV